MTRPLAARPRRLAAALVATAALTVGTPASASAPAWASAPAVPAASAAGTVGVVVGRSAWVAVSVATLWRSPSSPRAVDRPALANPVGVRGWLARMTTRDRLGLVGRADTQVLMGDRVVVTARSGSWVRVVVPDQPTPLDRRGYPGWVPAAQLVPRPPTATRRVATVSARVTWMRTDSAVPRRVTELSFGTRLPVLGRTGPWVRVVAPSGLRRRVHYSKVLVRTPSTPALPRTGRDVVRTATRFTGLPYLWAGRSGFGFDCSGLTSLDYAVHGVTIPRDADAQAVRGAAAGRDRRPGDLMFFARNGSVHHVSIYAGGGRMVQAPRTGLPVQTIPVSTRGYVEELVRVRGFIR